MKQAINYDQFSAMDIRVAKVLNCEEIEGADRLYKITLDAGDLGERTVAAGIRAWYKPTELIGKQIVYLANLEPRVLRGVESQGMILAADDEGAVLIQPEKEVPNGTSIK